MDICSECSGSEYYIDENGKEVCKCASCPENGDTEEDEWE